MLTVTYLDGNVVVHTDYVTEGDRYVVLNIELNKPGYFVEGWYSSEDGNRYFYGETIITGSSDFTLTADWREVHYVLELSGNGADNDYGEPNIRELEYNDEFVLDNPFYKTGYSFICWNTEEDGSGISYAEGETVSRLCDENGDAITLYAQWAPVYTVTYHSNGGSSAEYGETWSEDVTYLTEYYTRRNPNDEFEFKRPGYEFIGWNEKPDGSDPADWNSYIEKPWTWYYTKDVTLYAQWEPHTLTANLYSNYADYGTYQGQPLNVSADDNVLVHSEMFLYDSLGDLSNIQNPEYLFLSRTDYTPTGYWGTLPDGGELVHQDTSYSGQELAAALGTDISTDSVSINLYAQWKRNFNIDFCGKIVNEIVFNENKPVKHLVFNGTTMF